MNCWILPNGDIVECEYGKHSEKAMELIDNQDPEKVAERLGWLKISKGPDGYVNICFKRPTQQQRDVLFDLCTKFKICYPLDKD